MRYAKAFYDLQVRFAVAVAALAGMPLSRALLQYTNLYIRLGLGHGFDPAHPVWQEYVDGLERAGDVAAWSHHFVSTRASPVVPPDIVASFGCFSYARAQDGRIRLHFTDAETGGHSPLGIERRDRRVAELTDLFRHVNGAMAQSAHVRGASWLYNIDAYRRLFPPAYVATAQPLHDRFRHMPLWGQFLDRHGEVKESLARRFIERLERESSVDRLDECFPYQVLTVEAHVQEFYDFYGI